MRAKEARRHAHQGKGGEIVQVDVPPVQINLKSKANKEKLNYTTPEALAQLVASGFKDVPKNWLALEASKGDVGIALTLLMHPV